MVSTNQSAGCLALSIAFPVLKSSILK